MRITLKLLHIYDVYQSCMNSINCNLLFDLFYDLQAEIQANYNNFIKEWNRESANYIKETPDKIYIILNQLQTREILVDIAEFNFIRYPSKISWPTILLNIYLNQLSAYELSQMSTKTKNTRNTRTVKPVTIGKKKKTSKYTLKPICKYGNKCFRTSHNHKTKYYHPIKKGGRRKVNKKSRKYRN